MSAADRLQASVDRIEKHGSLVMIHHVDGGGINYCLQNGKSVSPGVVAKLRKLGRLVAGRDGLFGGDDQTLHLTAP
jgi:hypothetical protein